MVNLSSFWFRHRGLIKAIIAALLSTSMLFIIGYFVYMDYKVAKELGNKMGISTYAAYRILNR